MKSNLLLSFLLICLLAHAQTDVNESKRNSPNVFIITTDGFRWQEVFKGADSILIRNTKAVKEIGRAHV